MAHNSGYDILISFVATTFDRNRIEQVARHQFGAADVEISIKAHRSEPASRSHRPPSWEPKPGTGAAALLGLVREKGIVRSREFAHISNVRAALELLLMDGHIEKVRHGVYKVGGLDIAENKQIGRSHALGPRQKAILDLLEKPHTAAELRTISQVSRQAIDQLLKKLMKEQLIRRLPTAVESADWLYIRSGQRDIEVRAARTPAITKSESNLLTLLPPAGGARRVDIIQRLGQSVHVVIKRLVVKGLIEEGGSPKRRILRLTRKGLQHPNYAHQEEHFVPVEESAAFQPSLIKLMLALDVLGEARAIDLTDVSGVKTKGRTGTGQYMQRLRTGGYVEQIKQPGSSPVYRLTKAGLAAISSVKVKGRTLSIAEAQRRLAASREARRRVLSLKGASNSANSVKGSRTPELLQIVRQQPGLRAVDIRDRLSRPFADPRSIYVALKDFERHGRILRIQSDNDDHIRWSITPAGELLLSQLITQKN